MNKRGGAPVLEFFGENCCKVIFNADDNERKIHKSGKSWLLDDRLRLYSKPSDVFCCFCVALPLHH
jgi:hypothetical protein